MTVPLESITKAYSLDGFVRDFAIPFSYDEEGAVRVTVYVDGTEETPLEQGLDWTLVTVDDERRVRLAKAWSSTDKLELKRDTNPTQDRDFVTAGEFAADDIEGALDRLTRGWAELREGQDRGGIRPAPGWEGPLPRLPDYDPGKFIRWDASTKRLVNGDGPEPFTSDRPYVTAEELGMPGNGTADDSPALQRGFERYRSTGAVFFLWTAQAFRFSGRPYGVNGVAVLFFAPILLNHLGGLALSGSLSKAADAQDLPLLEDADSASTMLRVDAQGTALSVRFPVGCRVLVQGYVDSAGFCLQEREANVSAVDDGLSQLTLSGTLNYDFLSTYPATDAYAKAWGVQARTRVSRLIRSYLASDAAIGDRSVSLSAGGGSLYEIGQHVRVEDSKNSANVAGSNQSQIRRAIARITGISGDVIEFDRPLEHTLETARGARLVLFEPIQNAAMQRITTTFMEEADSGRPPSVLLRYAVGCAVEQLAIPGEDTFGRRGDGCRLEFCSSCYVRDYRFLRPRFWTPDEGQGLVFLYSSDCRAEFIETEGARHAVVFAGATRCTVDGLEARDGKGSDIKFRSFGEARCLVRDFNCRGCGAAAGSDVNSGVSFGDSEAFGGSRACRVENGLVAHHSGSASQGLLWRPGADDCSAFNVRVEDCRIGLYGVDVAGAGTVTSTGLRLELCQIRRSLQQAVLINGKLNGATVRTFAQLELIQTTIADASLMIVYRNADRLRMKAVTIERMTTPATAADQYLLWITDSSGSLVRGCDFSSMRRGIKAQNASLTVLGNFFADFDAGTEIIRNDGSITVLWSGNEYTFTPTNSGATTGITVRRDDFTPV